MPRYEQRARLLFDATDSEDAAVVEDSTATALNQIGAGLGCSARLELAPKAPRRLDELPRVGLVVSIRQAVAAAAGVRDGEGAPPVQLELSGEVLIVIQGDERSIYDLNGQSVSDSPLRDHARGARLEMSASRLIRQTGQAVACAGPEAVLSSPFSADQHR
jgi:hypothetical protein